ncbi:MAG TPA: S66 peptidase family protein [Mycobacteriales bacterium]|nr:S66 peptidase family protein [Mycobacteriales bacterium]
MVRYPAPLAPGDLIGVTSPSSGVSPALWPRLDVAVQVLRDAGYEVVVGECMGAEGVTSAPAPQRAAELSAMLLDPAIRAVVPPWGGELAIDLLGLLDFDALGAAEPTWLVGYSDLTTVMLPLTLRTGIATLHGSNLMDTPYDAVSPMLHWLVAATARAGSELRQGAGAMHLTGPHPRFEADPEVRSLPVNTPTRWKVLGERAEARANGRLIGGCLEIVSMLPGTAHGDLAGFAAAHAPEGLLVYVEVAEIDAYNADRMLHHLRLAGWFDAANAVLVGRSGGPASGSFTHVDAVEHALGDLPVPVFYDLDIGHVPPQLALVNGAVATIEVTPDSAALTQQLV